MKANELLFEANRFFGIEFQRVQKIASGLRSAGLFPDSRKNDLESNVTCIQAAHLLRAQSLNLNPFASDFTEKINEYKELISQDGNYFIDDFAEIIFHDGAILPRKMGANLLHHISFSLDRPRVVIVFEGTEDRDLDSEEPKKIEGSIIYGIGEVMPFERWAIVKRSALWKISNQLTDSNEFGSDFEAAEQFQKHLISIK